MNAVDSCGYGVRANIKKVKVDAELFQRHRVQMGWNSDVSIDQVLEKDIVAMKSPKIGSQKYSKVNQQRKFHLLTLIYNQKKSVREAAHLTGINFLTAKTIVFFYKNNYPTYHFDLAQHRPPTHTQHLQTASYASLRKLSALAEKLIKPKSRIEVVCSIGNILSPPVMGCPPRRAHPTQPQSTYLDRSKNLASCAQQHFASFQLDSPIEKLNLISPTNRVCDGRTPEEFITTEEKQVLCK